MDVASLLADNRRFAFDYDLEQVRGLTNHGSMALIALARLGATSERLEDFWQSYRPRLHPVSDTTGVDAIRQELASRGRDAVLREHFQRAGSAIAGNAFHGSIRTALALLYEGPGADDELAHGLAYLDQSAFDLPYLGEGDETDLSAFVRRLREARIEAPPRTLITDGLRKIVANPRFLKAVTGFRVDASTLAQVAGLGAQSYLAADDFASLHVLTGAHAVTVMKPWLDDAERAAYFVAMAALACFVLAGSPSEVPLGKLSSWERIIPMAITSNDDHLAKLVLACRMMERDEESAIFRAVATKVAERAHT